MMMPWSSMTIMMTKTPNEDNDGMMMGDRKLVSGVPPIRGNNQRIVIVGGEETRDGGNCGG
jgi:hypothetical protein